jgi:hypothetical protein
MTPEISDEYHYLIKVYTILAKFPYLASQPLFSSFQTIPIKGFVWGLQCNKSQSLGHPPINKVTILEIYNFWQCHLEGPF